MVHPRRQVRVARQSAHLDEVVAFYRDGLGLSEIDRFAGHAGWSSPRLLGQGRGDCRRSRRIPGRSGCRHVEMTGSGR